MKHTLLLLFSIMVVSVLYAQSPTLNKLYGGSNADEFKNIAQTTDGGYIVVGNSSSTLSGTLSTVPTNGAKDGWVVKVDANGVVQWQKLLGGKNDDLFESVQETKDGGYIIAGYSSSSNSGTLAGINSYGYSDSWLVKLDADGNVQWQKLFGSNNYDYASNIKQTSDEGYIVVGWTAGFNSGSLTGVPGNGNEDGWVMKLDAGGNIQWQKLIGWSNPDLFMGVLQTAEGEYLIAGYSYSTSTGSADGWLVKLSSSGNLLWQKLLGGTLEDSFDNVVQTADGGYILIGSSTSSNTGTLSGITGNGSYDGWIIKISNTGDIQWQKLFGGSASEHFRDVQQTLDGGFILTGHTLSNNSGTITTASNGGWDAWVLKLDATGQTEWQKLWGGPGLEWTFGVLQTSTENYIIAGYSGSSNAGTLTGVFSNGNTDGWLIEVNEKNIIKGTLFVDQNTNGIKDADETLFTQSANLVIAKQPDTLKISTTTGQFSAKVGIGSFVTSLQVDGYRVVPTSRTSTFSGFDSKDSISFALQPVTEFVFVGNGDWNDPSNWQDGLVPPVKAPDYGLPQGSTVTVNGNARINTNKFNSNNGTIKISTGGSLAIQNTVSFGQYGTFLVSGTLISETPITTTTASSMTISGTFENRNSLTLQRGIITIENGGSLINTSILSNACGDSAIYFGKIIVNSGGTLTNKSPGVLRPCGIVNNGGVVVSAARIVGNGTLDGDVENSGTLAPGNSPGNITVTGDYTATETAVHDFEVSGTSTSAYDQLQVGGNVLLNGTLNVSLINSFVPSTSDADLPIITGTISGTFNTVNIPSQYQLVYNSNSVVLRANATLPVTFSYVDVKREAVGAKLTWRMQMEVNVSHYDVEKSSDGRGFTKIGEVKAAALGQYSFVDASVGSKTFYRIRSVDRDGKYNYSIVVTYSGGRSSVGLNVYPSPAKSIIQIQHASAVAGSKILVSTMDGRTVQTIFPATGVQKTTVDVSTFSQGTYIIRYYSGREQVESLKFIKQ